MRFEFRYTPKHGSWLNMAEIEIGALSRQSLRRRIPDRDTILRETVAWVERRNAAGGLALHHRKRPDETEVTIPFNPMIPLPVRDGRCGARILPIRPAAKPGIFGASSTQKPPANMFIRATKTHSTADGKPVDSYRLVLSQRIGDKVRQRTLLNLGTDYPVARKNWKEVAALAEALLHGHPPLFEAACRPQPRTSSTSSGPGGSAPTLWRKTHANCDRQPRQSREPALGRLRAPVLRGAPRSRLRRYPPRPRHHGPRRAYRECVDRRQDDSSGQRARALAAR